MMYHFSSYYCDTNFVVVADTAKLALTHLKEKLKQKSEMKIDSKDARQVLGQGFHKQQYERWRNATLKKMPEYFFVEEIKDGEILKLKK